MPDLKTLLHLNMLKYYRILRCFPVRFFKALVKELKSGKPIYGLEWGDPDIFEPLIFVKNQYVLPYVDPKQTALEIGPGGGRWTRYLLKFKKIYVVDFHAQLLKELKKNFHKPNMEFIKNNGSDFPGIKERSIDYLFSFGVFVHLDIPIIEDYLENLKPILSEGANVVIQYSDKTKKMAQSKHLTKAFSDNTPDKMRKMVLKAGYKILEEDLTTMWHSSIIRFTID